jgi:hypothetical protein
LSGLNQTQSHDSLILFDFLRYRFIYSGKFA